MVDEMNQEVVLQDLDKVEALAQLDDLVRMGMLAPTRATFARHKYEELHSAIMETLSNGKRLLAESAILNERLKNEKGDLDKVLAEAAEDEMTLGILHEDVEQAESEAIMCREKEMQLFGEKADLLRMQKESEEKIREIEREHAAALSPQIFQMKIDLEDLMKEDMEDAAKIEDYKLEIGATKTKITQSLDAIKQLILEKKEGKKFLLHMEGYPEKLRKQVDTLSSSVKGLHLQEQHLMDKIKEYDYELSNLHNAIEELNDEYATSTLELEKLRHYTEQKEQTVGEMKKDIALNSIEADQYLADRVTLDMQLRSVLADLKLEQDQLAARVMERDKMLHRVKHAEHFLKQVEMMLPSLEIQKEKVHRKLVIAEHERKGVNASVIELKKDIDIKIHNYLQIENLQKEIVSTLHSGHKKVEQLEREVIHSIELEYKQQQQMGELASLREHMCRLLSSKLNLLAIAELKEKYTLFEVEHNMLQKELLNKDQLFLHIKKDLTMNIQNQYRLRSELIKLIENLSRKTERADEYVIEVVKLKSIISNTEIAMTAFQVQYEMWVKTRNSIGISLIDRNDELCILFEKSHAQLRLVSEEGGRLSELVEQPENTTRWRLLAGPDSKELELIARINHIEHRLSEKTDQELEKDLIIEEVTALSADLKKHAAEGWEDNLALEKQVNYYEHRMRIVTRQMMATVSELSLCQAMALSIQQEKETLVKALEEAYRKLEAVEPPTEDAKREWIRIEKTLFSFEPAEMDVMQNGPKAGKGWCTLGQRLNAYISEEHGLPKPFGACAPFKPSDHSVVVQRKPEHK